MAYTPTLFYSPGNTRVDVARSWADHWRFIWNGWSPSGPVPTPDPTGKLPAGVPFMVYYDEVTGWPPRPTTREDITIFWVDLSGLGGQPEEKLEGRDIVLAQKLV